jgi:hypothetical protein
LPGENQSIEADGRQRVTSTAAGDIIALLSPLLKPPGRGTYFGCIGRSSLMKDWGFAGFVCRHSRKVAPASHAA